MIPANTNQQHILLSIAAIDKEGVPRSRISSKFHLLSGGRLYPPKYVLSVANMFANGVELQPEEFSGGRETNGFLQQLGFCITGPTAEEARAPGAPCIVPDKCQLAEAAQLTVSTVLCSVDSFIGN